ncbi:MAG: ABC transporter ATP-binding protein/permease [Campylobacter sp.]|nr:ABC transporter ATP-binding protein/permease [Campylobacter sp.]
MDGLKFLLTRFSPYFKDYKVQFFFAILGMIMSALASAASAWLIDPVLNKIFIAKNEAMLYTLPYAVIAVYAIKSGGSYMQTYFTAYIGQSVIKRFRNLLVEKLTMLDMQFFNSYRTGELISRVINDIERVRNIVSTMLPDFFMNCVMILGLLGVVIYQSPKLAFFSLVVMPAAIYPLSRLAKKMKKISRQSQEKTSNLTSKLSEIFTNIEVVKSNNAQKQEVEKFKNENEKFFKLNLKSTKTSALVSPLMEVLGAVGIAVVIIIGGSEVINDKLNVGSFFSFTAALFMLYTPLKKLSSIYNNMQDAVAASERAFELADKTPSIIGGNKEFPNRANLLTFQDIWLKYDNEFALKGVSFSVGRGEMVALVGNSGGGKSSVVNALLRFYDLNSGNILVNNDDICEFSLKSLRDNIGLVTQRVYIFNDTIANNVCYGYEFDEAKVVNALKLANAYEFVSELENGIYTTLNEHGTNLSGGQRQRIAIARALYKDPQIIVFDEATSALDNASEKAITQAMENIKNDKILITIAHRLSTIKNADSIVVLKNSQVVGIGSDSELMQSCSEYQKLKGEFAKKAD